MLCNLRLPAFKPRKHDCLNSKPYRCIPNEQQLLLLRCAAVAYHPMQAGEQTVHFLLYHRQGTLLVVS